MVSDKNCYFKMEFRAFHLNLQWYIFITLLATVIVRATFL